MTVPFANTSPAPEPSKAPPRGLHSSHSLPHIWLMNSIKLSSEQLFSAFSLNSTPVSALKKHQIAWNVPISPGLSADTIKAITFPYKPHPSGQGCEFLHPGVNTHLPSLANTSQQKALWNFVLNLKEAGKLNHKWVLHKWDAPAPRAANTNPHNCKGLLASIYY